MFAVNKLERVIGGVAANQLQSADRLSKSASDGGVASNRSNRRQIGAAWGEAFRRRKVAVLFVQNDLVVMNCPPSTAETVRNEECGCVVRSE